MSELFPEVSFEESMAHLERLVRELEDGQLSLNDSLARYEQGVGLIKRCYGQLREAEQRVLLVAGTDESGRPILQPFDHEATALANNQPARRMRRPPDNGI